MGNHSCHGVINYHCCCGGGNRNFSDVLHTYATIRLLIVRKHPRRGPGTVQERRWSLRMLSASTGCRWKMLLTYNNVDGLGTLKALIVQVFFAQLYKPPVSSWCIKVQTDNSSERKVERLQERVTAIYKVLLTRPYIYFHQRYQKKKDNLRLWTLRCC